MRRLIAFLGVAVVVTFAACSNKDGGKSASTPAAQCGTGQVIDTQGRCLNHGSCSNINQGVDPNTGQCISGTYVGSNYYGLDIRFENQLSVTNQDVFKQMVKEYYNGCGMLIWPSPYTYLTSSSYLELRLDNTSADRATIYIGLGANAPDAYQAPAAVMRLTGAVYDINVNDTTKGPGLEIQADGSLESCSFSAVGNNGLDIEIAHGTFQNTYLDAVISYRAQPFARARLYSY